MAERTFNRLDYTFKLLMVIALLILGAILARDIIVPMAFAAILSVVMLPLVQWLEARKISPPIAITLVLLLTVILLALLIWLVVDQIIALANDLPNLQSRFESYINDISLMLRRDFGISTSDQNKYLGDAMRTTSAFLAGILLSTTNTLGVIVQIPIYIFLFLIYRDKFKRFIDAILPGREELGWKEDIQRVIQGYIVGLFFVTLIISALNSIGLLFLGIKHAIFFGVLSGVLTIIPYVGIILGSLFPILMALITKDSYWYAIGVVAVFAVVQFLEGNFITPRITGSKVSINALAAIVALLIGGKILGIAGMILAVPAIGIIKVILSHSYRLNPFVILLEDEPVTKKDSNLKRIPEEDIKSSPQ